MLFFILGFKFRSIIYLCLNCPFLWREESGKKDEEEKEEREKGGKEGKEEKEGKEKIERSRKKKKRRSESFELIEKKKERIRKDDEEKKEGRKGEELRAKTISLFPALTLYQPTTETKPSSPPHFNQKNKN